MAIQAPLISTQIDRYGVREWRPKGSLLRTRRNQFYLQELGDFNMLALAKVVRDNFGVHKVNGAVVDAYRKVAPSLKASLQTHIPVYQPKPNRYGRVPRTGGYPLTHNNFLKYGRRAGTLRKSVFWRIAKPPPGLIPDFMMGLSGFPWVFLRKGTAQRWTGRRGGPSYWTGAVPARINLSSWHEQSHGALYRSIMTNLSAYTGFGTPWRPKPLPPAGSQGSLF